MLHKQKRKSGFVIVKKLQACKPDSVSRLGGWLSFIWLPTLLPGSICLPSRRSVSRNISEPLTCKQAGLIWHFSTQGLPVADIPDNRPWALTPHFHPYPRKAGRLFSVALSRSPGQTGRSPPLAGALLCAVRTFLNPPKVAAIAQPAAKRR